MSIAAQFYDEMHAANGDVRAHCRPLAEWLEATPAERVAEKRREADLLFHRVGITFAVYGDDRGAERLIPFDTIPRIIPKVEWDALARGLKQRVTALNRRCRTSRALVAVGSRWSHSNALARLCLYRPAAIKPRS